MRGGELRQILISLLRHFLFLNNNVSRDCGYNAGDNVRIFTLSVVVINI